MSRGARVRVGMRAGHVEDTGDRQSSVTVPADCGEPSPQSIVAVNSWGIAAEVGVRERGHQAGGDGSGAERSAPRTRGIG